MSHFITKKRSIYISMAILCLIASCTVLFAIDFRNMFGSIIKVFGSSLKFIIDVTIDVVCITVLIDLITVIIYKPIKWFPIIKVMFDAL